MIGFNEWREDLEWVPVEDGMVGCDLGAAWVTVFTDSDGFGYDIEYPVGDGDSWHVERFGFGSLEAAQDAAERDYYEREVEEALVDRAEQLADQERADAEAWRRY